MPIVLLGDYEKLRSLKKKILITYTEIKNMRFIKTNVIDFIKNPINK